MDRTELAWAAGFWDGEGWAALVRHGRGESKRPMARVNQADSDGLPVVLTRLRNAVGVGAIEGPELIEDRQPIYRWSVSSRGDVETVFDALRQWLSIIKQRQFASTLGVPLRDLTSPQFDDVAQLRAWAAGFFDGEGSVYLARHRSHAGYFRLESAVTQSSSDGVPAVLTQFREYVGIGKIGGPYPAPEGTLPVYRWKAHRRDQIERMVDRLWPALGEVKRSQARAAMAVVAAQSPLPRGNPEWGNRKSHCVHGHDYEKVRLRPFRGRGKSTQPPRASHQCLACVREAARAKRPKATTQNSGLRRRSREGEASSANS